MLCRRFLGMETPTYQVRSKWNKVIPFTHLSFQMLGVYSVLLIHKLESGDNAERHRISSPFQLDRQLSLGRRPEC